MTGLNPLPPGPFGCILADPPWSFETYGGKRTTPHRGAEEPYGVVDTVDMALMDVATVAADDCALFMWVVDSHLDDALKLAAAWGFEFKTRAFTWRKAADAESTAKIGMGYWTRKQTEMCWLFTRGSPRRLDMGVREIIDAPRREHSRKPDEQYDRIMRLVRGPYLELFARQAWREGDWTAWGNQVGKFDVASPESGRAA